MNDDVNLLMMNDDVNLGGLVPQKHHPSKPLSSSPNNHPQSSSPNPIIIPLSYHHPLARIIIL